MAQEAQAPVRYWRGRKGQERPQSWAFLGAARPGRRYDAWVHPRFCGAQLPATCFLLIGGGTVGGCGGCDPGGGRRADSRPTGEYVGVPPLQRREDKSVRSCASGGVRGQQRVCDTPTLLTACPVTYTALGSTARYGMGGTAQVSTSDTFGEGLPSPTFPRDRDAWLQKWPRVRVHLHIHAKNIH